MQRTDRGPADAGADAVQIVYSPTERDVVFCVTRSKVLIMDISVDKVCRLSVATAHRFR